MMLHHITMHVSNLADTIDLLGAFGFACVAHTPHTAWIQAPNAYLQLHHDPTIIPQDHNFTDSGISHICIQTPDMRHARRVLLQHGARPLSDPINLGTGHWYLYARLPDGDIIEIEGVPYAPPTASPWLAHVALVSQNIPRLANFYQQLTATTYRGGQTLGPNPRFDTGTQLHAVQMMACWMVGLNLTIEGWQFLNPVTRNPSPHTYAYRAMGFVVDDVPQSCQHAVARGATIATTSAHDARLYDPDGNVFTLIHHDMLDPVLTSYHDPHIIARINALWRPLDPQQTWEAWDG